ncbi:MAG: hypothetical protein SFZ03_09600 [Candidatus Melainabacteria bacterium]|nr:hypothetical protein [Candidatus Melainabacteria bacterium]
MTTMPPNPLTAALMISQHKGSEVQKTMDTAERDRLKRQSMVIQVRQEAQQRLNQTNGSEGSSGFSTSA